MGYCGGAREEKEEHRKQTERSSEARAVHQFVRLFGLLRSADFSNRQVSLQRQQVLTVQIGEQCDVVSSVPSPIANLPRIGKTAQMWSLDGFARACGAGRSVTKCRRTLPGTVCCEKAAPVEFRREW